MDLSKSKADAARDLVERGFKIFPIKGGAKFPPLVKAWPAAAGSDLTPWSNGLDVNIGISCEDLLVLDVDHPKGGDLFMTAFELPPTLVAKTPNGRHWFYSCPGGVANSVQKLGPGLDVRSTGGYVVAPGSSTPAGVYQWVDPAEKIAPAPSWLVDLCQKPREKSKSTEEMIRTDAEVALERARRFLETQAPAVEGQGGDAHTYAMCCRVRDFGVPLDRALEALEEWNERCEPPWEVDELERKVENAYAYAQSAPARDSVEAMFEPAAPSLQVVPPKPKVDDELYSPHDVELEGILSTDYLIKGWLERGAQAMMFGKRGAGKTFCALHMAAHISAGQPWLSSRVRAGGVLYFGYEGSGSMRRRLYALRAKFPDFDMSTFMVRQLRHPLVKKNAVEGKLVGQAEVERALQAFKARTGAYPVLVVVDTLRHALGGSDSDADLTQPYLTYMLSITKVTGCATLTVHHPGHGDSDRARGDSGLEAHMDTVIKVDSEEGSLSTSKQRDDPEASLQYKLEVIELGKDSDGDTRTTCVVELVTPNPADPKLTDTQEKMLRHLIEQAADGKVTRSMAKLPGIDSKAVKKILSTLETKQYLVKDGKGWRLGEGAATEMFK